MTKLSWPTQDSLWTWWNNTASPCHDTSMTISEARCFPVTYSLPKNITSAWPLGIASWSQGSWRGGPGLSINHLPCALFQSWLPLISQHNWSWPSEPSLTVLNQFQTKCHPALTAWVLGSAPQEQNNYGKPFCNFSCFIKGMSHHVIKRLLWC